MHMITIDLSIIWCKRQNNRWIALKSSRNILWNNSSELNFAFWLTRPRCFTRSLHSTKYWLQPIHWNRHCAAGHIKTICELSRKISFFEFRTIRFSGIIIGIIGSLKIVFFNNKIIKQSRIWKKIFKHLW